MMILSWLWSGFQHAPLIECISLYSKALCIGLERYDRPLHFVAANSHTAPESLITQKKLNRKMCISMRLLRLFRSLLKYSYCFIHYKSLKQIRLYCGEVKRSTPCKRSLNTEMSCNGHGNFSLSCILPVYQMLRLLLRSMVSFASPYVIAMCYNDVGS